MASLTSEDESSDDGYSISSSNSTDYTTFGQNSDNWSFSSTEQNDIFTGAKRRNLVLNIRSRQLYGRFTKHSRARDERIFNNIHHRCRKSLSALLSSHNSRNQIFMGFTLCGQYFLSYTETQNQGNQPHTGRLFLFDASEYKYELHIWRFVPGKKLQLVSKHRIFNHLKCGSVLDKIMFMQFPNDVHKIVCYGHDEASSPDLLHISIITIPSQRSCVHCGDPLHLVRDSGHKPLCIKHGFVVDYMFALSEPAPVFNPRISLSYPDYLVVNTGHHIHILNVSIQNPNQPNQNVSGQSNSSLLSSFHIKDEEPVKFSNFFFNNDAFSEASETASDHCGAVDAILDNFSEYELDSAESGSKPFHELNISCEPLNVTGKSYHNTLVQQHIFDPRLKRLQQNSSKEYVFSMPQASMPQKPPEKSKVVDKKIAEKAYEFIEENEKYEKISLFRKKRLADKKYEFSEDNTENIVPFHILRRERRYRLYRSQRTELNSLFLSPCSPMQSPGQFSPSSGGTPRHIYCTSSIIRSSPYHYSRSSPVSPKDTRKINVYSPSLESDFSDSDSRLVVMRTATPHSDSGRCNATTGLLILDPKGEPPVSTPKWITKVVRRYSNGDFENSSLLSGQSRDDYNIPIEVPLLVQGLTEQHFEIVPDYITTTNLTDHRSNGGERHILVTQRSMDCEQFVQRRAQALCSECNLEFMHCADYDIKVIYVCPISGEILCKALIKLGALKRSDPNAIVENYYAHFLFTWNIETDDFDIIDSSAKDEKLLAGNIPPTTGSINVPEIHCSGVWVLSYDTSKPSKAYLRDPKEHFEVFLGTPVINHPYIFSR
ncbi:uncharacterized protein LOC126746141 isoform X2 [Anthonomus grandis grandis]|uniref:uncharacterized protein LOC126746141 isoform X2 n=1 Tax=Anthonomus grandis grandis TaxID=2921223 RepID=UPI002165F33F|nr:uncharacterized protein LOC126746141 isoform X2 [Anthonomus grandis grandis]